MIHAFLISFSTDFSVSDSDEDFNPPITKRSKQSVLVLSESDEEVHVTKVQY